MRRSISDRCQSQIWSKIATFALVGRVFVGIAITFGVEEPEWWNGVATWRLKILKICLFVSTEYTNVADRQTNRQTDTERRNRPHLCIALRGKNLTLFPGRQQCRRSAEHPGMQLRCLCLDSADSASSAPLCCTHTHSHVRRTDGSHCIKY